MATIQEMREAAAAQLAANSSGSAVNTGLPSDEPNGAEKQPVLPVQENAAGLTPGVTVLAAPPLNPNPQPIATAADVTGSKPLDPGAQVIDQAVVNPGQPEPQPQNLLQRMQAAVEGELTDLKLKAGRVFQHVYAGANTVMPDGKKIVFGGPLGSSGTFVTSNEDQIKHLEDLAKTPGSQISEIIHTVEGRDVATKKDNQFEQDQAAVRADAARNSALDLDPNVASARANLGNAIAQG